MGKGHVTDFNSCGYYHTARFNIEISVFGKKFIYTYIANALTFQTLGNG